ncbi:MAG: SAM-dependent methyltransferase [Gammaproteobacteria bacterium]|nr:SAM-dependent methyltransferase [Gammaproteobacteria bacterium]
MTKKNKNKQKLVNELPTSDDVALNHSRELQARICDLINSNEGQISFERFMRMALYEPGLGYYSAGASKIGEAGDFVTAPEISSLFSICLARQCAEIMTQVNRPVLLEVGAGSGRMAADILYELQQLDSLPDKYQILETSADLRERQKQYLKNTIPDIYSRVSWLDAIPEESFEGVLLANEVLDALPVRRFRVTGDKLNELGVVFQEEQFQYVSHAADESFVARIESVLGADLANYQDDYVSELNDMLDEWLMSLLSPLGKGAALFIDYGYPRHEYYHPQRDQGSLLCHYRHRVHSDPFINIGLQDITASVDFTALAEAADKANVQVSGYTTQAFFLLACGLEQILEEKMDVCERTQIELKRQVKLLTLPAEMGERFKVMALSRNLNMPLKGFSVVDHRRKL